jgi:deferrochelatase/peroxidase EfeB
LTTDQSFSSKTLKHRILRRGIPFGPPLDTSRPDPAKGDRGLLFLSYQTSIKNQFEFLVENWMNSTRSPTSFLDLGKKNSGVDLLVGVHRQGDKTDAHIERNISNQTIFASITTKGLSLLDWVIPTGGGYFFSPSISLLKSCFGSTQ